MFDSLKLHDLAQKQLGTLRRPSRIKPTLWVVQENGVRAVVKDFSTNGALLRNTAGRFVVWREKRAYQKLRGVRGVPEMYRVIDGLALVMEEVPGRNLRDLDEGMELTEPFFEALKGLIEECHRRGIAHCDLKRSPNILMGYDGLPYIVDWGASIAEKEFSFFPLSWIYRRFLLDDSMAIIKLKLRHLPQSVPEEARLQYSRRSIPERIIRAIRNGLQKFFKSIL